jgi:protein-disulfide isomerase
MKMAVGVAGGLIVGTALGYGIGAVRPALPEASRTVSAPGSDATLMELDGVRYKEVDLPGSVRTKIFEVKNDAHERVDGLLSQFALQLTLAKAKDKDAQPDMLPEFDQLLDLPTPKEDESKAFFEANKSRLPPNTTYEQTKSEIETYLKKQKMSETLRAKHEELKTNKRLVLMTQAPETPPVQLDLSPFAAKGTGTATVVEVADYLCAHCQATQPEVEELLTQALDKIKFVAVPFSLRPNGLSGGLARGAFCARQQGDDKFWSYHEKAFATSKAKGWKATDADDKGPVLEVAAAAGLDAAKMEACLGSPEAQDFLKTTVEAFVRAGVSGTPTFFMDGRKLPMSAGKSLKERVLAGVQAAKS